MYPELFTIPFTPLTVKSYGLMMVVGFLTAVSLIRRLSRDITPDPQMITNASLYSLIAGVIGARVFYIVHHFDRFQGQGLFSYLAIWQGGLELLGGVILAIGVIFFYLIRFKLPVRRYLDILAIGLMAALAFGRIGCFLNSCCFGRPTNLPWAVRFPYGSWPYQSQISPDQKRNRPEPYMKLPGEFFGYVGQDGVFHPGLKPYESLTSEQKYLVDKGPYRCLPVHPTQLYSSTNAVLCGLILYLFWRRSQGFPKRERMRLGTPQKNGISRNTRGSFIKPGHTFALMFILYGTGRFFMEFVRDDNPFEYGWWMIYEGATVSQNLGIYMVILGLVLMIVFASIKPRPSTT